MYNYIVRFRRSQEFLCVFAYNFCMKIFCERFKDLRIEHKLTTIQLGKELKVSNSTITRWENETIIPSIEHLYNIAVFFNVTTDYLLGLED